MSQCLIASFFQNTSGDGEDKSLCVEVLCIKNEESTVVDLVCKNSNMYFFIHYNNYNKYNKVLTLLLTTGCIQPVGLWQ